MRRLPALLAVLAVAAFAPLAAQATPGDNGTRIAVSASRKYQALTNFQAQFRQELTDKYIEQRDSKGAMYQEGKSHFAMRWSDPPKESICLDGSFVWMYFPSTSPGTVKRFPQQSDPTYGTNLVGTFLDNPADRYRITYVKTEMIDGHYTDAVMMEPINGKMQFQRATVWLDRDLGMPRKIEIQEKRDAGRVLYLSNILLNRTIPPDMFACSKLPGGTKILDQ